MDCKNENKITIRVNTDDKDLQTQDHAAYQSAMQEISEYSTTPNTIKERKLFDKSSDFIAQQGKHLQQISQKITTLKLQTASIGLQSQQSQAQVQKQIEGLERYEKFIATKLSSNLWFKEIYEYKLNLVERYGINASNIPIDLITSELKVIDPTQVGVSVSTSKYKQNHAQAVTHHSLEKFLLRNAVDDLMNSPNKTTVVLVDIFERDGGTSIIGQDSCVKVETKHHQPNVFQPKIHTVVLYKNQIGNEIVVIDPSNFVFSSHLCSTDIKDITEIEIKVIHNDKLQIYKPNGTLGPQSNQYRHCDDIAVKIALGLNVEKPKFDLQDNNKINSIKQSDSVKEVTNQKDCYQYLPNILEQYPVRAKQSSDMFQRKDVTLYSKILGQELNKMQDIIDEKDLYHLRKTGYVDRLSADVFENKNNMDHGQFIANMHNRYNEVLKTDLIGLESSEIIKY